MSTPVAFSAGHLHDALVKAARRQHALALDGVLVRDWNPGNRKASPGLRLGARVYAIDGIRFASITFPIDYEAEETVLSFLAVDRKDYLRLYRSALRSLREVEPPSLPPILSDEQSDTLWKNTIGYLESDNLERIRAYGGRARRGVLLTGAPGNGKTMACRWIWEECRRRRWEYRIVTPNNYRQARRGCDAENAVRALFTLTRRGVVFFDDMDLALRDRETVGESEDQAIFLTALDGLSVREGVVYVFTTNCGLDLIDRAFKRPGRIDVVLNFEPPPAALRERLMQRWHREILAGVCLRTAVSDTDGYSFAEIEELRNLLIMRFTEVGEWDWRWARKQFTLNREEFSASQRRQMGFSAPLPCANGKHDEADAF